MRKYRVYCFQLGTKLDSNPVPEGIKYSDFDSFEEAETFAESEKPKWFGINIVKRNVYGSETVCCYRKGRREKPKFFKLSPVNLESEYWQRSKIKENIIVEADNEQFARQRAARFTETAVKREKRFTHTIDSSPWEKPELSKAEQIYNIPEKLPRNRVFYLFDDPKKF